MNVSAKLRRGQNAMSKASIKRDKLKTKEKLALALFMEAVPKLIELWHKRAPEQTFDEFCLAQYEEAKTKS